MAIEIDTSRPLRSPLELAGLVRAIVGAHEHDESDWLEWKRSLDLGGKEGCFPVARAILGMANREPERAAAHCGGLGYVVVGAEPGSLGGLVSADPATFSQIIDLYLGGAVGPQWYPTLVGVDGVSVLVVTVESPQAGDPIFPLRKAFTAAQEGAVFVRKQGRTSPADAADMDALGQRLLARAPSGADLEVELLVADPIAWLDTVGSPEAIQQWADEKRSRLIEYAQAVEQQRQEARAKPKTGVGFSVESLPTVAGPNGQPLVSGKDLVAAMGLARQSHLAGFTRPPDTRSLKSYVEDVDQWRDKLAEAASESLLGRFLKVGYGALRIQVKNTSPRFLQDVELDLILDWGGASLLEEPPRSFDLPDPPRTFGSRGPSEFDRVGGLSQLLQPHISPLFVEPSRSVRRAHVFSDVVGVRYRIGNLPQGRIATSEPLYLLGTARPGSGAVSATWDATIRVPEERLAGTCEIRVADEATAIDEVFGAAQRGTDRS